MNGAVESGLRAAKEACLNAHSSIGRMTNCRNGIAGHLARIIFSSAVVVP